MAEALVNTSDVDTQSGSNGDELAAAGNDANQNFGSSPVGAGVQACVKKSWIGIKLVDQENNPVPGELYQVELPNGSKVKGKLDATGVATINEIDPGTCEVSFPNRDANDWKRK